MTSIDDLGRYGMFGRAGVGALLIAAGIGLAAGDAPAQTGTDGDVEAADDDSDVTAVDRGRMRLNLLIKLVENELEEAALSQSRLTVEAAELEQERQTLLADASVDTEVERRRLAVIEDRLKQIDEEMARVNDRLPEIETELADLQARRDEADGIVREPETDGPGDVSIADGSSLWLDGKRQIQEALVYLGGYNALIDGDFGPRTQTAIRVYQQRQNLEVTGQLTDEQQAALLKEAETLRMRYGMKGLEDRDAGYRLRYPSGLLSEDDANTSDGRRFTTRDGKGELVITSIDAGGNGDLRGLFQELVSTYEVQYRRQRDDWFVVAGLIEEGRIVYDTARLNDDRLIRARLSYPAEWRDLWSPFAVIMFNTFEAVSVGES